MGEEVEFGGVGEVALAEITPGGFTVFDGFWGRFLFKAKRGAF